MNISIAAQFRQSLNTLKRQKIVKFFNYMYLSGQIVGKAKQIVLALTINHQ